MAEIDYHSPGPVASAFLRSNAFIRGIRGPIGSGKSTACVMEILRRAQEQKVSTHSNPKHRRRYTRWAIVRNTQPELKTTTIKTWHQWVPREIGSWREHGPPTHHIRSADMDMEVLFVALDRPEDVRKVLSMELTGVWVNEAREVPKAVIDGLTGRVGRYPAVRDGGCSWRGIIMDTNPPDTDHWWYVIAERDDSTELGREIIESTRLAEQELRADGLLGPDEPLMEFFSQPGGREEGAENLDNIEPGYYARAAVGKRQDWIKVYVDGRYGYVQEGKPVYPEYNDNIHCQRFEINPNFPIDIGLDFGLTPAAIFGQQLPMGQVRWRTELVSERMGAVNLAKAVLEHLAQYYPGCSVRNITGDPSGSAGQEGDKDEQTVFQILKSHGVDAKPAHTNEFSVRRDAVADALGRLIDGEPGLLIHPDCKVLRKGMQGGYKFKRMAIAGQEGRYHDKPDKDRHSHPCEAGQYFMLGAGAGKTLLRGRRDEKIATLPRVAIMDYDLYGS